MATHFYCQADDDCLKRGDFFSTKSLLGSRLGSALIPPHDLLKQSEGVPPATSEIGGTPTLGRSIQQT
ncbi:MAG: hypothetical protein WCB27_14175 [Thermoguttaceae bacterium]|jgi:hypothetical protein